MPVYEIKAPDGQTYEITAPDGATQDQVLAYAQQQWSAKPKADPVKAEAERLKKSIVDDMGTGERLLVGAGKAFNDIGMGVGQMLGLVPDSEVNAQRALDRPLMDTTAGTVGNVAGNIAAAIPAALIPGGQTLAGAALTGAGLGVMQPVADGESRMGNAAIGGAGGAAGMLGARAVAGLYGAGKALVDPFRQSGREAIAGRMLQRFASNPQAVAAARPGATATGARPTLAELTGDEGIARLQDSLRTIDPQIGDRISARLGENNAARLQSLQSIAGDDAARAAAVQARDSVSGPLYQQATRANYTVDAELSDLLQRPAIQRAMAKAEELAKNQGRITSFDATPSNPFGGVGVSANNSRQITGQALQDLKMAMDEMLSDPTSGFSGKAGNTLKDLRGKLVGWMEDKNPAFKAARETYAQGSKPINAMDIGEFIAGKATRNTSDLAGNPRMQANALLRLLKDEQGTVRKATGRKELSRLDQALSPDQLTLLRQVAAETDRAAAVASAGNGPGSATAQRMASQNILRQLVGPTGLPESWAESVIANTAIGKPMNLIYGGVAEPKIQQLLADAVLNPETAQNVLKIAAQQPSQPNKLRELLKLLARPAPAAAALQAGDR